MPTYNELLSQIEALKQQAEAVRRSEIANAVSQIREIMDQYGLSIKDLQRPGKSTKSAGRKVAAKYRDPASGATWSGRGKAPKWLAAAEAAGKKREQFAV